MTDVVMAGAGLVVGWSFAARCRLRLRGAPRPGRNHERDHRGRGADRAGLRRRRPAMSRGPSRSCRRRAISPCCRNSAPPATSSFRATRCAPSPKRVPTGRRARGWAPSPRPRGTTSWRGSPSATAIASSTARSCSVPTAAGRCTARSISSWRRRRCSIRGDLGFPVFAAAGATVGLMICFDWIFPEAARSLALAGADPALPPVEPRPAPLSRRDDHPLPREPGLRGHRQPDRRGEPHRHAAALHRPEPDRFARRPAAGPLRRREEGAATAVLDPAAADKRLTPCNDLWEDRRPEAYRL